MEELSIHNICSEYRQLIVKYNFFSNENYNDFHQSNYLRSKIDNMLVEFIKTDDIENFKTLCLSLISYEIWYFFIERLIFSKVNINNQCTNYLFSLDIKIHISDHFIPFSCDDYEYFRKVSSIISGFNIMIEFNEIDDGEDVYVDITNEVLFLIKLYRDENKDKDKILEKLKEVCSKHDFSYEL